MMKSGFLSDSVNVSTPTVALSAQTERVDAIAGELQLEKMRLMMKRASLILLLGLSASSFLAAQEFTGRVSDPTGAVLARVAVTAHNLDTNLDTPTVTTASGTIPSPI